METSSEGSVPHTVQAVSGFQNVQIGRADGSTITINLSTSLDPESARKFAAALDALSQRQAATDSRLVAAKVVAMIRSKNVMYYDLDEEVWEAVFLSLRHMRDAFAEAYSELLVSGPDEVQRIIEAMLTITRNYIGRFESSFRNHMDGPEGSGRYGWHAQDAWPMLAEAESELLAFRGALAALASAVADYARKNAQVPDEAVNMLSSLAASLLESNACDERLGITYPGLVG